MKYVKFYIMKLLVIYYDGGIVIEIVVSDSWNYFFLQNVKFYMQTFLGFSETEVKQIFLASPRVLLSGEHVLQFWLYPPRKARFIGLAVLLNKSYVPWIWQAHTRPVFV